MNWGPLAMRASVRSVRALVEAARGPLWGCGSVVGGRTVAAEGVWRDRVAGITIKASTLRHKQTPPFLQAAFDASGGPLSDFSARGVEIQGREGLCTHAAAPSLRGGSGGRARSARPTCINNT